MLEDYDFEWKPEPPIDKEMAKQFTQDGVIDDVRFALGSGLLVGYRKDTEGKNNRDLVIKITIRHKDCIDGES